METFTPLESAAMRAIFQELPGHGEALARQLQNARVISRENTGHGFFTGIAVPDEMPGARVHSPINTDIHARIAGMQWPMGFLVWLEGGKLNMLEGFGYGDDFSGCDLGLLEFEIYKENVQRLS